MAEGAWVKDPTGRHELRYWDGSAWTEHVSNAGVPEIDPVSLEGSGTDGEPRRARRRRGSPEVQTIEQAPPVNVGADSGGLDAAPSDERPQPPEAVDITPTSAPIVVFGGTVEARDGALFLSWKGINSSREQKKASPHRLDLRQVTSIQAHEPGKLSNGWVRFGPDTLDKTPSMPPRDLFTVVFTRSDAGYQGLLVLVEELSRRLGVVNALPPPTSPGEQDAPKAKWADLRPDIASAASRLQWTMGGKREIKKLEEHLRQDERVDELAQGTYTQNQGIVALTDQRLLFLFHGIVNKRTEEFSVESITAVEVSKTLNTGTLRLRMSGNSCEITQVFSADLDRIANAIRMRIAKPAAAATAPQSEDPIELIKRLGELREAGLLSDDQYESKKEELLRRL